MPAGRWRDAVEGAADSAFDALAGRVLAFDETAAEAWADIVSGRERHGSPIEGFDAQIAAICRVRQATLATRNTKDFVDTGVHLVDPWQAR